MFRKTAFLYFCTPKRQTKWEKALISNEGSIYTNCKFKDPWGSGSGIRGRPF